MADKFGLKRYDLGIYTLVVFGILILILGKFAWGPMMSGLDKREATLRKAHDDAEASRLEIPVFATFAYSGALVWSATFILLGYFLGDQWEFVLARLQDNIFEGTLIVLAILALIWILRRKLIRLE